MLKQRKVKFIQLLLSINLIISTSITLMSEVRGESREEIDQSFLIPAHITRLDAGKSESPLGDPFSSRSLSGRDQDFGTVATGELPPGIRVLGVLAVSGRKPIGVLEVPGAPDVFFVTTGDVIQVDRATDEARSPRDDSSAVQSQLYLLIQEVRKDAVTIAPRTRPQETRIYR